MFLQDCCGLRLKENVVRQHCRANSQFLKRVMYDEEQSSSIKAKEILMTAENPIKKEQQLTHQICRELKRLERENLLKEQRRVALHRNEHELRELILQIKRAHTQKQLVEQKTLKENKRKDDLQARLNEQKRFSEERKQIQQVEIEQEKAVVRKKSALRQDLLRQMQEKDKQLDVERGTIAKERESRIKLLHNIQQDDEKEQHYALQLKQKLRKERDEYLKEVKLHKRQKEVDAQEDHKMEMELVRQRNEDRRLRLEKRRHVMQERARISERIGQQVLAEQTHKQQHDDLLLELLIGERLAKADERHKINLEKQMQRARSLREDLERTFLTRQQQILLRRENEKREAEEQLKVLSDLERKDTERRNLEGPRKKQYRQDLLNAIEYKNRQRQSEAALNKIEQEQMLEVQKGRLQEIQAEKLRLLKDEPLQILKFLPPHVLSEEQRSLLTRTCKDTQGTV